MNVAKVLKNAFPWLGTQDGDPTPYPSGADAIDALEQFYRQHLRKPAKIDPKGNLVCGACKSAFPPEVVELGYDLTHEFIKIDEDKQIHARGGGSENFSEEGDETLLQCANCYERYEVPEGFEVFWV